MQTRLALILLSGVLGACAARAPDVDPQAARDDARIVGKTIESRKAQARADAPNTGPAMLGMMGPSGLMVGDAWPPPPVVTLYRYVLLVRGAEYREVLSNDAGFELGDCVVLLTSSMPRYPRLARGGDCTGIRGTGELAPVNKQ